MLRILSWHVLPTRGLWEVGKGEGIQSVSPSGDSCQHEQPTCLLRATHCQCCFPATRKVSLFLREWHVFSSEICFFPLQFIKSCRLVAWMLNCYICRRIADRAIKNRRTHFPASKGTSRTDIYLFHFCLSISHSCTYWNAERVIIKFDKEESL